MNCECLLKADVGNPSWTGLLVFVSFFPSVILRQRNIKDFSSVLVLPQLNEREEKKKYFGQLLKKRTETKSMEAANVLRKMGSLCHVVETKVLFKENLEITQNIIYF